MIKVHDNMISVSTITLDAVIWDGVLISLKDKNGREFLEDEAKNSPALETLYRNNEVNPIAKSHKKRVHCISLDGSGRTRGKRDCVFFMTVTRVSG